MSVRLQRGGVETDEDWNEEPNERRYGTIADAMRPAAPSGLPDWTDGKRSDPGITLLQLLAFLAGALVVGTASWLLKRRFSTGTQPGGPVSDIDSGSTRRLRCT